MMHERYIRRVAARLALLLALAAASTAGAAAEVAAEVSERVAANCGGCHDLRGPADDSLAARSQRKAPPLFYAGNKFREDWLVAWLQNPTRI